MSFPAWSMFIFTAVWDMISAMVLRSPSVRWPGMSWRTASQVSALPQWRWERIRWQRLWRRLLSIKQRNIQRVRSWQASIWKGRLSLWVRKGRRIRTILPGQMRKCCGDCSVHRADWSGCVHLRRRKRALWSLLMPARMKWWFRWPIRWRIMIRQRKPLTGAPDR